jgi:hypothetical protein
MTSRRNKGGGHNRKSHEGSDSPVEVPERVPETAHAMKVDATPENDVLIKMLDDDLNEISRIVLGHGAVEMFLNRVCAIRDGLIQHYPSQEVH